MFGALEVTAVSLAASMFGVCPPDCTAECCATADESNKVVITTSDDGDDVKHTIRRHISSRIQSDDADGVGSLRVELNNDDLKAWLNNKELGDGRVKIDDGHIIILGDDGKILHKMPMHVGGGGGNVFFGDGEGPHMIHFGDGEGQHVIEFDGDDFRSLGGMTITSDRPRIGVTMRALDGALAKHLGVDGEGAFVIADVIKGLPAHTGGLRGQDVVIRVNGESASIDGLRRIVQEAGDDDGPIRFRVLRDGDAQEFEIEVDSHFGGEFEFEGLRDFTVEGMDDFDGHFQVDGGDFHFDGSDVNFKVIQEKVRKAMQDGRFEGIIKRFGDVDFGDFGIDDVHRIQGGLREAQELPGMIMERFGGDSGMLIELREQIGNQLHEMDPETREMIMEKVHKAMEQAKERFGGGEWNFKGGDGPSTFELFSDGESDEGVIIFHEGEGHAIAPQRVRMRSPEGEGQAVGPQRIRLRRPEGEARERILFEVAEDDDGGDRFSRLEERLERLEKMLEKLADRLGDRR